MKLGVVVDGGWAFIRELLADWESQYPTRVFAFQETALPAAKGRINRWRLRQSLKQFLANNDVVFFEWAGPLLVVASHLEVHIPICVRLHSYELVEYAPKINWNSIERVVLVSNAMRRRFCELYPVMSAKTTVVYNGVALDRFTMPERQFSGVIGMLGNLIPIKRIYEVILALYELNRNGNALRLQLAGQMEKGAEAERYYLALQRLVHELGLEQQVSFMGPVSKPETFLQNVDIFISNSFWEGQQVALLEAMASGCYCLSHCWDGANEVLPEENLFYTDTELQEKILAFCAASDAEKQRQRERMRMIACDKFNVVNTRTQMRNVIGPLMPNRQK